MKWRSFFASAVALSCLLLATPANAFGSQNVARACPMPARYPEGVVRLIRCAAPRLGVPSSSALYVGQRESRFQPRVCNASNHCGVFQVYPPLWSHMVSRYVYGHLLEPLSRVNGRANVLLSLRLMAREGFWPWR